MSDRRLILFDFDGTLADTFPEIAFALNTTRFDYGWSKASDESIRKWIGYGLAHFMESAIPEAHRAAVSQVEFTARYKDHYRDLAFDRARLFDGIEAVLDAVADDVLAVVSNKSIEQLEPMVEQLGIRDRFAAVVGGNSIGERKPSPAVYHHVLEQVDGASQLQGWMIGDSEPDVEFGKNSGLRTIGCAWGLRTREELQRCSPDHLVTKPSELVGLLKRPPA
ncbi:MAG: HAD family hydrolase [Myxococcota bacterium]